MISVGGEVLVWIDRLGDDLEGSLSFRGEDFEGSFETEDEGGFETCDDGGDGGEVMEVEASLKDTWASNKIDVSLSSRDEKRRERDEEGKDDETTRIENSPQRPKRRT